MAEFGGSTNRRVPVERDTALCIDCDGTLVRTDLMIEAVLRLLKRRPLLIFPMIGWLLAGKAAFKARVAGLAPLEPSLLPLRPEVIALIEEARAAGRRVVLATAAHRDHAEAVATHLRLFDHVLATDENRNLSSEVKAVALAQMYGAGGFDYVGDSPADLPVWAQARKAYCVGNHPRVRRYVRRRKLEAEWLNPAIQTSRLRQLGKAMRPHQWLKNLLVFIPALAGHAFTSNVALKCVAAFFAFSLCASSVYITNDLLDLDSDRAHPSKRARPFAAGNLSLRAGLTAAPLLFLVSLGLAAATSALFLGVLVGYALLTTAYSARLKQQVMVDVMLLGVLYTLRIIGGGAATGVIPSFWLLAFSMFLFFSLALVKRYSELLSLAETTEAVAGRGYRPSDLPVLLGLGVGSGMCAVMVLALYVDAATTRAIYPSAVIILLAPALMLYWIGRLWTKAHRGEVHEDPVIFAARDWQTLVIAILLALLFGIASTSLFT